MMKITSVTTPATASSVLEDERVMGGWRMFNREGNGCRSVSMLCEGEEDEGGRLRKSCPAVHQTGAPVY